MIRSPVHCYQGDSITNSLCYQGDQIRNSLFYQGGKNVCLKHSTHGFDSHLLHRYFYRSSHTSDFKIGTPVATQPGAWRYWVSAGTGQLSVSILNWVRQKVSSVTSVSVWQHIHLSGQICPIDTLACRWDVKQTTNKQSCVPVKCVPFSVVKSWL